MSLSPKPPLKPSRGSISRENPLVEALRRTWREFFVTLGRYDGVVVADFPAEATPAPAALTLWEGGNVTTETSRSFSFDEFRGIVDAMP